MDRFLDMLRPLVCRWAIVWTGSPDEAEDVAQAVLLKVSRSLDGYVPSASVATWAYRITRNTLVDFDRRAGREQTGLEAFGRDVQKATPGHDGLERLHASELLARFVRDLSPQQRAALDLVELQGFSHAEAADMLGVEPATLRVHLHRARQCIARQNSASNGPGTTET